MRTLRRAFLSLATLAACSAAPALALAEPTDPVVIGWWSYFSPEGPAYQIPTTDPAHPVDHFGDPDTYFYEPSGGHGLQDPSIPADQAWQSIISFTLAKSNDATLSPDFTIDTGSDLSQWTQAYFGWALVLLYVPKDKYCDSYRIHIGSVDDGVQAMANAKILGYANLGDQDKYIDMVENGTSNLVLRPGINEVVLIHEDQAQVQRYVHNVWIEHDGTQIPLAPKNTIYGRVTDATTQKPIYKATVGIQVNGAPDTFTTGPFGFYFFDNLPDGSYPLTADAAGYQTGTGNGAVAKGAGATEVVRTDLALTPGCECPSGKVCGPSGGCLEPCVLHGEFGEQCDDPLATCVNHACVKSPCDTLTCAPGFECQPDTQGTPPVAVGRCVEIACTNVCCGAGQVCSAGACVTDNCGAGCGDGKSCSGGNCVDSCTVLTCVSPLACVNGVCLDPCVADPASCQPDGGIGFGGQGGSTTGAGGSTGTATGAGGKASGSGGGGTGSSSGCGCEVGSEAPGEVAGIAALGLLGALVRRRRPGRPT